MYRIGTLTDPFGEIIFQGETDSTILTLKDSYVSLVPGKRVVVSDLGQGNNQWAIVRTLGVGPPPPPPSPVGLGDTGLAGLIALLSNAEFWAAAWVRTVRYSLTHFDSLLPGIQGTAYATLFRPPSDYRLMVPIEFHAALYGADSPGTLVNLVLEGPSLTTVRQVQPARVVGPGATIQDPSTFDYGPMPAGSAVGSSGYWFHPTAQAAGFSLRESWARVQLSKTLLRLIMVQCLRVQR